MENCQGHFQGHGHELKNVLFPMLLISALLKEKVKTDLLKPQTI